MTMILQLCFDERKKYNPKLERFVVYHFRASFSSLPPATGAPLARRGRGGHRGGRGRFGIRRDIPMKFEKDFDFESANAQFNKEEIDREFHNKLKLKGI